jgi:hypothetical protein
VINNPTNPTVKSDTVCFNTEVLPLFITYCASAGCHDPVSKKEGVITNNYANIMKGITAKNPNKSEYYKVIIDREMLLQVLLNCRLLKPMLSSNGSIREP